MKTGFSLCTFSHREKPVSISWDPCNENRFFPVGKKYTGKSLFWPCTDPVRDCSVYRVYQCHQCNILIKLSTVLCIEAHIIFVSFHSSLPRLFNLKLNISSFFYFFRAQKSKENTVVVFLMKEVSENIITVYGF